MKAELKDQKNNHIVKVEVKEHYGTERIYVVSEHQEYIQRLTGHKTITKADVEALKGLGFKFEIGLTPIVL